MGVKFSNNAEGTLSAGINASVTTLTLNAGQGAYFPIVASGPDDFFYATLTNVGGDREVIKVTQHTAGDVFQVIERAVDSVQEEAVPTAYAFLTNDTCQLRLPKIALEGFNTGSSSESFQIDTENDGPILKNNSDTLEIKLGDDSDYTDLHAENLTLESALALGGAITGATNITASGTIQAEQITSTDDITAVGTIQGEQITSTDDIDATGDITAGGTVQGEHLYSTDDAVIDDDLAVGGTITATGQINASTIVASSTVQVVGNLSVTTGNLTVLGSYLKAPDHGNNLADEVVNVVYNAIGGSVASAAGTTEGTLLIQYVL